jgi:hypothetical protein
MVQGVGVNIQILAPLTSILSPTFAEAASRRQALRGEEELKKSFVGKASISLAGQDDVVINLDS